MRRTSKAPSATAAASAGTTRARRTMFGLACLCVLGLAAFLGSSAPSVGAAESFPGQGFLPDNRAWEMVSPPDKSGGDVTPVSSRTRAAADGSAVNFTSLVGFGNVQGASLGVEYIAERTAAPGTSGWATHGITPAIKATTVLGQFFGGDPAYEGEMSPDLSRGVFRAFRPLGPAPNVDELQNLYVRDDLRTPGPGSYQLMSEGDVPVTNPNPAFLTIRPVLAGASADFSKIIFQTGGGFSPPLNLTSEGEENFQTKLYESDEGNLRLAGRIPPPGEVECDDETAPACEPAPSSQAGQGAADRRHTSHMISAEGSRIFFQAPIDSGNVYMREDGQRTVQLNVSEKTSKEAPQGASVYDASADGSRIFFTTGEGLVEGDEDGGEDIYMAEPDAPAGQRLTLVSVDNEPAVTDSLLDVIGASEDGEYLYFMMFGQLVAGEDSLVDGLYAWHNGAISYIGAFASSFDYLFLGMRTSRWAILSNAKASRLTPDGRHLLFEATDDAGFEGRGGLVGYDHGNCGQGLGCAEFYLYSAETGKLRCASCNPSGAPASAHAFIQTAEETSNLTSTSYLNHPLSSDGRYAFFNTKEALVPEDTNDVVDPYQYDAQTEEIHILSSGEDAAPSYFLDASADGRDVFINTRERLSGWDVDTSRDLYDARVNGGLPEPQPAPPSCQGDACQPAPLNLNDPTPASSGYAGPRDPRGRRVARCGKGRHRAKVRGKSRCVKSKSRKRAKNKRRAGK